jgi:hypothetical protein
MAVIETRMLLPLPSERLIFARAGLQKVRTGQDACSWRFALNFFTPALLAWMHAGNPETHFLKHCEESQMRRQLRCSRIKPSRRCPGDQHWNSYSAAMAEDGRVLDGPRVARRPHLDNLSRLQSFAPNMPPWYECVPPSVRDESRYQSYQGLRHPSASRRTRARDAAEKEPLMKARLIARVRQSERHKTREDAEDPMNMQIGYLINSRQHHSDRFRTHYPKLPKMEGVLLVSY